MQEETRALTLVGRRSSLFTRVPLFLAAALEVPLGFEPVMDMTDQSPAAYGGNPALKLPTLRAGGQLVFGAFNICRRLAAHAPDAALRARITWPEDLRDPQAPGAAPEVERSTINPPGGAPDIRPQESQPLESRPLDSPPQDTR